MRAHGSQRISHKMYNRHPLQLKNSNPGSPFELPIWPNVEVNGLDWHCCLAASSKRAPRILIFSIAMDADYAFYVKSIETHVRAFLPLNISAVSSVSEETIHSGEKMIPHMEAKTVYFLI